MIKSNRYISFFKKNKFLKYSFISLCGLLSSTLVFYILNNYCNLNAYYSNLISDGFALVLVFIYSWYFIFDHSFYWFKRKFIINTISKIILIYSLSILLGIIEKNIENIYFFELNKIISEDFFLTFIKLLIAPFTLLINYFLTRVMIEINSKKL
tara:strand:- start:3 stop:464 length:462 start_codon:yes stop_codon:yes gene_type:complete